MAGFRRAFFGLLAAFALASGYGWTVAALSYPSTAFAVSTPVEKDDGCGQPAPHNCAIPYCGPVCIGVTPAIAAVKPAVATPSNFDRVVTRPLRNDNFEPEPPPPRAA